MWNRTRIRIAAALGLATLALPSAAQCPVGPDGLDGPCWTFTASNLPAFPGAVLPAEGICWLGCLPQPPQCLQVFLSAPAQTSCDGFVSQLTVQDCAGAPLLDGLLQLDYTRTWEEMDPVSLERVQVWRFLAKVDLAQAVGVPPPCTVPACLGPWPTAFYYGYVDYVMDCGAGTFETSLVVFHGCDHFQHQSGLSSRPGSFHPGRSFAIVAPTTAANPFVAGNLTPPVGPLVAEGLRNKNFGPAGECLTEDPLAFGATSILAQACLCALSPTPDQTTARRFFGEGTCTDPVGNTSAFLSLDAFPILPWVELMTHSIGSWTTTANYPGPERAWVDEGAFLFADACSAAFGAAPLFADVFYGATTAAGWPVLSPPPPFPPLTQNFTDLASNYAQPIPGPIPLPILGNVMPTRHLIYVNTP